MTKLHKLISMLVHDEPTDEALVHFHSGPQGQPAVCDNPRCQVPRLTV